MNLASNYHIPNFTFFLTILNLRMSMPSGI